MKAAQSCPTVSSPTDCALHGILQARTLERVAIPFSRGSSQPRDQTQVFCIADTLFCLSQQGSPKSGHSPTVINMHYRAMGFPSGSVVKKKKKSACQCRSEVKSRSSCVQLFATPWIVHGILQARILEWVAIPFSRGSSQPRDRTQVSRIAGGFFTN